MSIRLKFILLLAVAFFVPLLILGYGAIYSLQSVSEKAIDSSSQTLITSEQTKLRQVTGDQASAINVFLKGHVKATIFLQHYFDFIHKNPHFFNVQSLTNLYPEKNNSGLPGYGFIHKKYGSYADFERRGNASPWLPKRVVTRVLKDPVYKQDIIQDLNKSMLMNHVLALLKERYQTTVDLVWIVLTNGISNENPPYDIEKMIEEDPAVNDMDETQNEYVRLADPQNNPEREVLFLEPYLDPFKHIWMTSCIAPLYEHDNFLGTVGMDILLDTLVNKVLNIKVGFEGYAFLISKTGKVIAIPEQGIVDLLWNDTQREAMKEILLPAGQQRWTEEKVKAVNESLDQAPDPEFKALLQSMQDGQSDIKRIVLNGKEKFVSFAPIEDVGWSVGIVVPVSEILSSSKQMERMVASGADQIIHKFLWFALFIIGVSIMMAILFHFHVMKPLEVFTESVSQVAWDNLQFDGHPHLKRQDEIGLLYEKFDEMIQALKSAKDELTSKSFSLDKVNKELSLSNTELSEAKQDLKLWGERLEREVADRTEQLRKVHEQLSQSERLAALGKLAGAFSHELRNPLAVIQQAVNYSLMPGEINKSAEIKEHLEIIKRQTDMAIKIVTDALEFARPHKLDFEKGELSSLINEILSELPISPKIIIEKNFPAPIEFVFDRLRIRHALINLIRNSLQALGGGEGKLMLSIQRINDQVVFSIKDTGDGMSEESMSKVFEPFFTTKSQGVGLGLYVTKNIVEMHGGTIEFSSVLGEETTAVISLPFKTSFE